MRNGALKQQAVPLVLLGMLLLAAIASTAAHQRLKQERRSFSIEYFGRLMHRIDVAIESISDTMIEEGMAADFEELLSRAREELVADIPYEEPDDGRVDFELTGIVWNPHVPLAFVNGMTVGKGDRIGNAEIMHIGKESVSVRYPDKTEMTFTLIKDHE